MPSGHGKLITDCHRQTQAPHREITDYERLFALFHKHFEDVNKPISLRINAQLSDTQNEILFIPSLVHPENQNNLISRLATRRSLTVGEEWSQDVHFGNQSELRYSYHVVCNEHYHGEACSAYCRPRNDTFGHYTCDDNGNRRCQEGWSGEYCAERKC